MGLLGGNPTRVVRAGRPCAAGFNGQTGSTGAQASDEPNGAAEARFHGVLSRGGLPSNSGYRESVTAQSVRNVESASADVEADGREEPKPGAGRGKRLCCWSTRAAARQLLAPTRAAGGRDGYCTSKRGG